jgi:hypothetical protein
MDLPLKSCGIDKRFCKQKICLLGAPGIGKSSFLAQEEGAFFFDLEGGLNFLDVKKLPIRTWEELREVFSLLKKAKELGKFPYTMLVIDPVDRLIDIAEEHTILKAQEFYKKINVETIADIPEGKGWDTRRRMVSNFLDELCKFDCAVAYVSHLEIKRIEEETRKYDKTTISIGGKVGGDLLGFTDHTLHIQAQMMGDKLMRTVYTKPTQSREAKSRGGIVPDGWKWLDDDKENWKKFRSLFI